MRQRLLLHQHLVKKIPRLFGPVHGFGMQDLQHCRVAPPGGGLHFPPGQGNDTMGLAEARSE